MTSTSSLQTGTRITLGEHTIELQRPLVNSHQAWTVRRLETNQVMWLWTPPKDDYASWVSTVTRALTADAPGQLPTLLTKKLSHSPPLLLLAPTAQNLCACDEILWQKLTPQQAIIALQNLTRTLLAMRKKDISMGGLKREHLHWDEDRETLVITSMPRARKWRTGEDEECWRDIKLIGDLIFESILKRVCPNGHELAAILQNPTRMKEVGLTQPGLIQILAGCVTPYGEIAYLTHEQLIEGLAHLEDELHHPMTFEVGARSTMGSSIFRKNNQDSFAHLQLAQQRGSRTNHTLFACVADGIGGISDGEKASGLVTKTSSEAFVRAWSTHPEQLIEHPSDVARAITKIASQRLAIEGEFAHEQNRGGTTFSAIIATEGRLGLAHIGDSRVYLIRNNSLIQLTEDHTLATILDNLGDLGKNDPKPKDVRDRTISRFLTTAMEVPFSRIDTISADALRTLNEPEDLALGQGITLLPDDLLVLSSDGLHEDLSLEKLLQITQQHNSPQHIADALCSAALQSQSKDNITVLVIRAH